MANVSSKAAAAAVYKDEVRKGIVQNSGFDAASVTMNALATVVACEGLFSNSSAVVIGAMIIAVLLGPIMGIALSLVDGNSGLLKTAILSELGGALVVLVVAFLIGIIHKDLPLTDQIMSRTSPNILDLSIALAGGAAGAYATVSPRLSVGLVGVAIATALVPPLSVCAICAARGDMKLAWGGFLLFFANLVAIQAASSLVMWLHGFRQITAVKPGLRTRVVPVAVSTVLLAWLAVVLTLSFWASLQKEIFETAVRGRLKAELRSYPGVYLAGVRFDANGPNEIVIAVVLTPDPIEPEKVAALESKLQRKGAKRIELHVRSVITKETTRSGYLYTLPEADTDDDSAPHTGQ